MASSIHDFAAKLSHSSICRDVTTAVRAREKPHGGSLGAALRSPLRDIAGPASINLDLTVACNYRCTHCIDAPILNTGHRLTFNDVLRSLVALRITGLRSVILIGGGEPTLHPQFGAAVAAIKSLGLQCGIVSNGSGNDRIRPVARWLTAGDWIRLSLDAGRENTFQIMHRPRSKSLTLAEICTGVRRLKDANSAISIGFSFIVAGPGAVVDGSAVAGNIGEMAAAAELAKSSGFDFISFKPLLDRDDSGGEAIARGSADQLAGQLAAARIFEDEAFRVHSSLNLTALGDPAALSRSRVQPNRCHMHLFRQVVTPTGVYGCPVYRGNAKDRIGPASAYTGAAEFVRTRRGTAELMNGFDARRECGEISCLYNSTNWWLQSVSDGALEPAPHAAATDFFL